MRFPYDFLLFVLIRTNETTPWTIHGLWPNRYDGSYPSFCKSDIKFDSVLLDKALGNELKQNWPSKFLNDDSFHKHEWMKHGACIENFTPVIYFGVSLALYHEHVNQVPESFDKNEWRLSLNSTDFTPIFLE